MSPSTICLHSSLSLSALNLPMSRPISFAIASMFSSSIFRVLYAFSHHVFLNCWNLPCLPAAQPARCAFVTCGCTTMFLNTTRTLPLYSFTSSSRAELTLSQ